MKTKYDWSNVPEEVQFLATDSDGWAYGFAGRPIIRDFYGIWSPIEFLISISKKQNPYKGDWQDSLEERPK